MSRKGREFDAGIKPLGTMVTDPSDHVMRLPAPLTPLIPRREVRGEGLPRPLTSLIGREREVAAVVDLLRGGEARLLVLTGPGGVGKTRIALQVATELGESFAAGVWFVPLAPVDDAALVVPTIAQTLGIRETGQQALIDRIVASLGDDQRLLVLDNFEQVVAAAASVAHLLAACPRLSVLVTSRAVLHVYGERNLPVLPLSLPNPSQPRSAASLIDVAAVRLFVDRVRANQPDFALTDANAPSVAAICQRLDGVPLAIELAAARSNLLAPAAILSRLDQRLPLLTGGPRDVPARHQAMRDAIAWSYDLLSPDEQTLFRRLAVFADGCTLEAAEAVADTEYRSVSTEEKRSDSALPIEETLAALADQSLIRRVDQPDGEPRLTMLETIREYGLEQLAASGEEAAVRQAHAEWFLSIAERADAAIYGPEQGVWLARLGFEHDNLRAALSWLDRTDQAEVYLRLAGALWAFWNYHGHVSEGRTWLERSQSLGDRQDVAPTVRANALHTLAMLVTMQGEHAQAVVWLEEAERIWREAGDRPGQATALMTLGYVAELEGEDDIGRAHLERAAELCREARDHGRLSVCLENLADLSFRAGDLDRAAVLADEAVAAARAVDDRMGVAVALADVAQIAIARGDRETAVACLHESLTLSSELGYQGGIADALAGYAATVTAEPVRAACLLGAADALREAIGAARLLHHTHFGRTIETVRQQLGQPAFITAWSEGRSWSIPEAIAEALSIPVTPPAGAPIPAQAPPAPADLGLTVREHEILRLLVAGNADRETAALLSISPRTVERHVGNILNKLGLPSRTALVAYAVRHNLD